MTMVWPWLRTASKLIACVLGISAVWLLNSVAEPTHAEAPFDLRRLAEGGGYVVLIRHAQAPGIGDPPDFILTDCATQRNLDESGRAQARHIGQAFRTAGITDAAVYSSQWCRCLETARLMDLGPVSELPALNSFYQRPRDRAPNIQALREFLNSLPADGNPVFLVTHQVTIYAITGSGTASGEAMILKLQPDDELQVVGRAF